jgi:hypothetical protein
VLDVCLQAAPGIDLLRNGRFVLAFGTFGQIGKGCLVVEAGDALGACLKI